MKLLRTGVNINWSKNRTINIFRNDIDFDSMDILNQYIYDTLDYVGRVLYLKTTRNCEILVSNAFINPILSFFRKHIAEPPIHSVIDNLDNYLFTCSTCQISIKEASGLEPDKVMGDEFCFITITTKSVNTYRFRMSVWKDG